MGFNVNGCLIIIKILLKVMVSLILMIIIFCDLVENISVKVNDNLNVYVL